jgi:hypothetical protein
VIQIKGVALRGLLKTAKESGWPKEALVAAIPEAQRGAFKKSIVASSWYPYEAFTALAHAVVAHTGGDIAICRRIGREAAVRDLGTTFRIITAMASIDFLLGRSQVFWSSYCDRGELRLDTKDANSFRGRMQGFPEIDPAHCLIIEGWLEGMGTALGAVDMTSRQVRCVHRGDPLCEFEGRWSRLKGLFR